MPDVGNRVWRSNADFFHRGANGQWCDVLDEATLAHHASGVAALVDADAAAWAHHGRLGGEPEIPHRRPAPGASAVAARG